MRQYTQYSKAVLLLMCILNLLFTKTSIKGAAYHYVILMLLIPLYAAGSDLPSLPAPFPFHRQLMVVVLVRCAGFQNISHYFLN